MAHPIRIVVVNYPYADDLAEPEALLERYRSLTGWSEAVAEAGGDISVVQRFHRDAKLVRNGIAYVFCKDGREGHLRSRLWPRRLHRTVAAQQPDVVHVNDLNAGMQVWFLRRAVPASTAIVAQDHGGGELAEPQTMRERLRLTVKRISLRAVDAFLFTATAQADRWRRLGLISHDQPVHQVLEASTALVPTDRLLARQTTGIEGQPAILWVGRLNANKAPLTVLDGFERCLRELPGAVLTMIYGTDDLLPSIARRLEESPLLAEHVRLVGSVPHARMAMYYTAADLFVLGSHHEASSYALLEACSCGLPPVVTDIPAFREITDGGSIGALWSTGDADSLRQALLRVARAESRSARQSVLERFNRALSWPTVGRAAFDAYVRVHSAVTARK